MSQLVELANLFNSYNIYPRRTITSRSAFRIYQHDFPENYYSLQMEQLIQSQAHESTQRGADLPWWGRHYFDETVGRRTLVIAQDSLSPDAGSIVFYACFMPGSGSAEVRSWVSQHGLSTFRSWDKAKRLLQELIDWDYTYITDASKVYRTSSWKDRDFDKRKSADLLRSEIEVCNPDLVILLGSNALALLHSDVEYRKVVGQQVLQKENRDFIVAPCPSVANANGYEERKENTIKLVKAYWSRHLP